MRSLNAYGRAFLFNSFHESKKMIEKRRRMEGQGDQGIEHPDSSAIEPPNG